MRKAADFRFGKTCLQQRAADMEFAGSFASGPVISGIVCIGAIHDGLNTMLPGEGGQLAVCVFLAKEAAIGCVFQVCGIRCFIGIDQDMLRTDLPGDLDGFEPFRGCQAGRDGCHGNGFIPKHIIGHLEHQTAVGTPGISHQDAIHFVQNFFEFLVFFVLHFHFLRVFNHQ